MLANSVTLAENPFQVLAARKNCAAQPKQRYQRSSYVAGVDKFRFCPRSRKVTGQMLERLVGALFPAEKNRHLVGDGEAIAFECDYLSRMVGEHAQALEAEVDQDLGADSAFMLQQALPREVLVELSPRLIQNMRERAGRGCSGFNSEAASGVVQVNEHSAIFRGDGFERVFDD